jgi:rod shape-determining protein MreC
MSSFLATRTARRRTIAFVALLAVSLILMAFSANPVMLELQRGLTFALRPFQAAVSQVAGGVATIAGTIGEIDELRIDNAALRQEVDRLENENRRLNEFRRENELLTGLLQLRSGLDHETVVTQVIARETLEGRRLVVLDKGTEDGISQGDVVIVQGGALAGRVTEVGLNFAKVTLITDGSSTVIGQLFTSTSTGEVVGDVGGVLTMRNIDSAATILPDEEVFTAGIEIGGGIRSPYPKGLLIGRVVDVVRDANDVVQTAYLSPAARLDNLEYALVIVDYEGGLPPIDEQPVPCDGEGGVIPDGEVPCYTPTPAPPPTARPTASPG